MTIADSEHMGEGTLFEVGVQNKGILILLSRVAWHIPNPRCKCIFSDDVVLNVLLLL